MDAGLTCTSRISPRSPTSQLNPSIRTAHTKPANRELSMPCTHSTYNEAAPSQHKVLPSRSRHVSTT
eukprot:4673110-Pleurochrysis_carterae.AAC.5